MGYMITVLHLPPSMAELAAIHPPVTFSVSSFCDTGLTASGKWTVPGVAGCSPEYPFGTRFILADGQVLVCEDRGLLVTFRYLDIWAPSCEAALVWGRRRMTAWTIEE